MLESTEKLQSPSRAIRPLAGGSVNPSETGTQLQQRKGQQHAGTVGIWGVKGNRREDLPHPKTVIDTGNTQLTSRMSQQAKRNSKAPKSFQGKRTNAERCLEMTRVLISARSLFVHLGQVISEADMLGKQEQPWAR